MTHRWARSLLPALLLLGPSAWARPFGAHLTASPTVPVAATKPATVTGTLALKPPPGFRPSEAVSMMVDYLASTDHGGPGYHPMMYPQHTATGQRIILDTALLRSPKAHERGAGEQALQFAKAHGFSVTTEETGPKLEGLRAQLKPFGLDQTLTAGK